MKENNFNIIIQINDFCQQKVFIVHNILTQGSRYGVIANLV